MVAGQGTTSGDPHAQCRQTAQRPHCVRGSARAAIYFIKPLKLAKAGFVVEQSASVGMTGVQQLMGSVIRNVIGRMDGSQLLSVGNSLRRFMR